jgi:hypothetical protein
MATPKRWSRTVGTQRGNRIRVYEREPGGTLHAAVWDRSAGSTSRPASATATASAPYVM